MKILTESPVSYKGDVYCFDCWKFTGWLEKELRDRATESEAFVRKFGRGWTLYFGWDRSKRITSAKVNGPYIDRKYKKIRWVIDVPFANFTSADPRAYVQVLEHYIGGIVAALAKEGIDGAHIKRAIPNFIKAFISSQGMIEYDPHPYTFGTPNDPYGLKANAAPSTVGRRRPKAAKAFRKRKLPVWRIPRDISRLVARDEAWEDNRYKPMLLTVMTGTSYQGRKLPLVWQIEFDPYDDLFAAANQQLEASGTEPDGDGWADAIGRAFAKRYPRLAGKVHSDSESSTCVLWVESEDACKKLVALVWSQIYGDSACQK